MYFILNIDVFFLSSILNVSFIKSSICLRWSDPNSTYLHVGYGQVSRPTAQVLMGDGQPYDQQQENSIGEDGQKLVTSEDFEVRIIEPAKPGTNWEAKAAIKMHITENALTVRIVSIKVCLLSCFVVYCFRASRLWVDM